VNDDDDSKLALHQSVLGGSLSASEYLLQNGAKINMRDCRGRSALHYAALLGQTGYVDDDDDGDNDDDDDRSVLHYAALLGQTGYVDDDGDDGDNDDDADRSALHYAALLGQTGYVDDNITIIVVPVLWRQYIIESDHDDDDHDGDDEDDKVHYAMQHFWDRQTDRKCRSNDDNNVFLWWLCMMMMTMNCFSLFLAIIG